jgi:sugar phosphate isomerase/epimerase
MLLGYNTNGFAHHRLEDALAILAELGYGSVALTLDHHVLNPFEPDLPGRTDALHKLLDKLNLRSVIETGARFLLDPRRKHQPTLLSPSQDQRERRLDFLCRAIDIARELGAEAVSLWSGAPEGPESPEILMERLVDGCLRLSDYAEVRNVRLAFEPEPGMFIDSMCQFARLFEEMRSPWFGLTLDVGHLYCLGEELIPGHIQEWRDILWNIHIEDMRPGVHEHLMFGEGEMDFPPLFQALAGIDYQGGVHVELSRHSHDAVSAARRSIEFLRTLIGQPLHP